jgi:hypothetical protein
MSQPYRPLRPVTGIALLFTLCSKFNTSSHSWEEPVEIRAKDVPNTKQALQKQPHKVTDVVSELLPFVFSLVNRFLCVPYNQCNRWRRVQYGDHSLSSESQGQKPYTECIVMSRVLLRV